MSPKDILKDVGESDKLNAEKQSLESLHATNLITRAAAWCLFGNKTLTVLYAQHALTLTSIRFEDAVTGRITLAFHVRDKIYNNKLYSINKKAIWNSP